MENINFHVQTGQDRREIWKIHFSTSAVEVWQIPRTELVLVALTSSTPERMSWRTPLKKQNIYIITDLLKNSYKKVKPAPRGIEGSLLDSCIAGDNQKLVIDLVCLIQSSVAKKNPVQILVLWNLVTKLMKNNNHHYTSLIKDLSGLIKNKLCPTNYALLAEAFGWARATTTSHHSSEIRLDTGINFQTLEMAFSLFKTVQK